MSYRPYGRKIAIRFTAVAEILLFYTAFNPLWAHIKGLPEALSTRVRLQETEGGPESSAGNTPSYVVILRFLIKPRDNFTYIQYFSEASEESVGKYLS
jgi:hypothetical protein